jgi:ATPase family AAA domain-containing protein 3A/B
MVGNQATSMLTNPKFLARSAYLFFLGFSAFHLTRIGIAMMTGLILARFGKPQLVRETSKIHTRNYFAVPYLYAKKLMH